jgi:hypothetical protein
VTGSFGNAGEPAQDITHLVKVNADAPESAIHELIRATDFVAEIHNTIRYECWQRDVKRKRANLGLADPPARKP